ncbi:MAG: transporter [Cytophagaceae bacterium]|nr:transporter [Cytophagaceae bacterium]|tara:strand:+ start:1 stop:1494 length:1494 start_codon:yes stop_codon:yes gene_type:complete
MKKLFLLFLGGFLALNLNAQSINDAVRYSTENILGTARYRGVGGAFGALGGDLSALNNNPAGSSIFTVTQASATFGLTAYDNQTYYFDGITTTDDNDVDLNQAGVVYVVPTNGRIGKLALGFNYDKTANYNDTFVAAGRSNNSIDGYFLNFAQGTPLSLLKTQSGESIDDLYQYLGENESFGAQQAFLGFQGFVIDPVVDDDDNTQYVSNVGTGSFDQEYNHFSRGYSSKASFNISAQVSPYIYLGANLNVHVIDYRKQTILFEDNNNGGQVTSLRFENNLDVLGNGFSAQLGGIFQVAPDFRVGATYDTPTWYTISEELTQSLVTDGANGTQNISPNVVNVYEDYDLRTPGKITGSASYVFSNIGFLSFDYSYQDFGSIKFKPDDDPYFASLNEDMSNTLKAVSTYKLGGEYKARNWAFRAGYRFQESPYEDEYALGNLTGYSLGVGYTFGNSRLDFAYDRATQERNPSLYDNNYTNTTFIDTINSAFLLTYSLNL